MTVYNTGKLAFLALRRILGNKMTGFDLLFVQVFLRHGVQPLARMSLQLHQRRCLKPSHLPYQLDISTQVFLAF